MFEIEGVTITFDKNPKMWIGVSSYVALLHSYTFEDSPKITGMFSKTKDKWIIEFKDIKEELKESLMEGLRMQLANPLYK